MRKIEKCWWVLLACCGLSASFNGICINSVGVFYTPVSESLGVLRGTFAMHATIATLMTALANLWVPRVFHEDNFKRVIIIGACLSGGANILMAAVSSIPAFYLLGALRGMGNACYGNVVMTLIINQWFRKRHGMATGIMFAFSGVAGAIFSPLFSSWIVSYGWRMTYVWMGILIVAFCLPAAFIPYTLNPEKGGWKAYGAGEIEQDEAGEEVGSFRLITISFLSLFIFTLLVAVITAMPQHFPGFAGTLGYSERIGAWMVSLCMVGNILGKFLMGTLSDRLGAVKAVSLITAVNVISILLMFVGGNGILVIYTAAFLFGTVYAVPSVGVALLAKRFFGVEHYGRVYSFFALAGNAGSAVAMSLIGYVYDFTGSYLGAFAAALVIHGVDYLLLGVLVARKYPLPIFGKK